MKKIIIKSICFFLVFCCLFYIVQEVVRHKWGAIESLEYRNQDYLTEPEGSIDVLFMGTSAVLTDITPMIIWRESGITAVNFGTSTNSPLPIYYQLKFALETQTPKVVVLDFNNLNWDARADVLMDYEVTSRRVVDTLPSWKLRYEMIRDICKDSPNQNILTYFFPLFEYHDRWNQLAREDFLGPENTYKPYLKGALFDQSGLLADFTYDPGNMFDVDVEPLPVDEYSWKWYSKIIDVCKEKGIQVAAICLPVEVSTDSEGVYRSYKTLETMCADNGIPYYNLNRPEIWWKLGITKEADFYNGGHMNWHGSIKISNYMAKRLQEDFGLTDHRGDEAYGKWNSYWDEFYADYGPQLAEFGY